jgi:hypothetical protein
MLHWLFFIGRPASCNSYPKLYKFEIGVLFCKENYMNSEIEKYFKFYFLAFKLPFL